MPCAPFVIQSRSADHSFMPTALESVLLKAKEHFFILARRLTDSKDHQEQESRKTVEHLERFCQDITRGMEAMTFEERQQLLRLIVERITVENSSVRIESVIPTGHDDQLRIRRGEVIEP